MLGQFLTTPVTGQSQGKLSCAGVGPVGHRAKKESGTEDVCPGMVHSGYVSGRPTDITLDTGVGASLLDISAFQEIPARYRPSFQASPDGVDMPEGLTVLGIGGQPVKALGCAVFDIQLGEKIIRDWVWVVELQAKGVDFLLGLDLMERHHMVLNIHEAVITVDGRPVKVHHPLARGTAYVRCCRALVIPAETAVIASAKVDTTQSSRVGRDVVVEPMAEVSDELKVSVPRQVVRTDAGEIQVRLENSGPHTLEVPPGELLAYANTAVRVTEVDWDRVQREGKDEGKGNRASSPDRPQDVDSTSDSDCNSTSSHESGWEEDFDLMDPPPATCAKEVVGNPDLPPVEGMYPEVPEYLISRRPNVRLWNNMTNWRVTSRGTSTSLLVQMMFWDLPIWCSIGSIPVMPNPSSKSFAVFPEEVGSSGTESL